MIDTGGGWVRVVDAQIHLWPDERRAPDPGNAHRGAIAQPVEEVLRAMDVAGVDRALLVPPAFSPSDSKFVVGVAQRHRDRFAVMAKVMARDGEREGAFARAGSWLDSPVVFGYRITFGRGRMAQLADGSADWFWALAQERGAPVMVQVPGNVPALVPVLERYPGLRLIIDHAGVPNGEAPVDVPEAVRPVLDLARFAQVAVKASALPGATGQAYPFPAAQRSVRMLVEAFGAQRVFWGSDLSRLVGSYREAVRYLAEPGGLQGPELVSVLGQGLLRYLGWAG